MNGVFYATVNSKEINRFVLCEEVGCLYARFGVVDSNIPFTQIDNPIAGCCEGNNTNCKARIDERYLQKDDYEGIKRWRANYLE